jgi:hypothetical protein
MEGMSAAYFFYQLIPGLIDATAHCAQAAREAGLRSIVNMSQTRACRESNSHQARDDWISERVFSFCNVPRCLNVSMPFGCIFSSAAQLPARLHLLNTLSRRTNNCVA